MLHILHTFIFCVKTQWNCSTQLRSRSSLIQWHYEQSISWANNRVVSWRKKKARFTSLPATGAGCWRVLGLSPCSKVPQGPVCSLCRVLHSERPILKVQVGFFYFFFPPTKRFCSAQSRWVAAPAPRLLFLSRRDIGGRRYLKRTQPGWCRKLEGKKRLRNHVFVMLTFYLQTLKENTSQG